jgi:hypothetical protein
VPRSRRALAGALALPAAALLLSGCSVGSTGGAEADRVYPDPVVPTLVYREPVPVESAPAVFERPGLGDEGAQGRRDDDVPGTQHGG